jgi:hypothetical protein
MFHLRYYQKNPINYYGIELLYGNSPDERYSAFQSTEQLLLTNYKIKLEKNTALFHYHELKLSVAYAYEEFALNSFRNRLTLEALIKIRI